MRPLAGGLTSPGPPASPIPGEMRKRPDPVLPHRVGARDQPATEVNPVNANDSVWIASIALTLGIFVAIVGKAVWRHITEKAVEECEPGDGVDEELERRIRAAWEAFADEIGWGPCRFCDAPDEMCVPFTKPCCSRCGEVTDAHPAVEKPTPRRGGDSAN